MIRIEKKTLAGYAFFAVLIGSTNFAKAAEYQIDSSHSEIGFKVKHLGISTVSGSFGTFNGSFSVDPKNIKGTSGKVVIDVNSINTANTKRDNHLKSPDFFDAQNFPTLKFESKEVRDINEKDSTCTLIGNFTLHGVTKEIALKVKGGGIVHDGYGGERAAFTATGRINRYDYGLKWNKALEAGALVVSQEVDLVLAFEGVRQLTPAAKPVK